jgi:hypothetical protein
VLKYFFSIYFSFGTETATTTVTCYVLLIQVRVPAHVSAFSW